MALANTLVARALTQAGLCFGNPLTQPTYLRHCYPGDTDVDAKQMGKVQSSCLVSLRGLLAEDEVDGVIMWWGAELDVLRCPYVTPGVFTLVETLLFELGRQRGLLVTAAAGDELANLQPADIVVIGSRGSAPTDPTEKAAWLAAWGGVAHGFIVTGVTLDDQGRTIIESIDGGQTDKLNGFRSTAIERNVRRLERRGAHYWLVAANGGARRLNWRLRAGALPLQ